MTTVDWRAAFASAADRARQRAYTADVDNELIACGFTNNVDLVVELTSETLGALLAAGSPRLDGPRQTTANTPDELLTAIAQHVAAGEGVDIPVANAETQEWLISRVQGRRQLGGTGVQAANTLATLGFSTFVHLTGCSPEQAAVFDVPDRIQVTTAGSLQPVHATAREADPTMWHVALEYVAGTSFLLEGRTLVAPHASRIIVSYDPINSNVQVEDAYVAALLRLPIVNVLISGYTQVIDPYALDRFVTQSIAAVRRWRAANPAITIHVELGAMPHAGQLGEVVERLAPEVTSIGMNVDELRDLAVPWNIDPCDHVFALTTMAERFGTPRINIHTATFSLSVTKVDPIQERDAVLFGALVASTRARTGRFPTFTDLAETLAVASPHSDGIAVAEQLTGPTGIRYKGDYALVSAPTIEIPSLAATVGLGDSFTAGVLAIL